MEFIKKYLSRKFVVTIAAGAIIALWPDVAPELKAKILAAIGAVYVAVEGAIDLRGKKRGK